MGIPCIVTDAYVQFPQPSFHGRQMVRILPLSHRVDGKEYPFASELKASDLPPFPSLENFPVILLPTAEQICQFFATIEAERAFDRILAILTSSQLSPIFTLVRDSLRSFSGRVQIEVIDSHSTSIGLGFLIQNAIESILRNSTFADVELLVRRLIPQIYAIICAPGLSYLHRAGFMDQAQALVGEMLGLQSLFALEEGHLTPLEKVRNHRQVLDSFQEFLDEFENLQHIGLVQNVAPNSQDSRLLREHAQANFPRTPFTEHGINLALAALLGPQTSCLFTVELQGRRNR